MNISVGVRDGKRRRFSTKRNSLLGYDASLKLLRYDLFKILLNQQIRGRVTKKESSVPVSLTTNLGEDGA